MIGDPGKACPLEIRFLLIRSVPVWWLQGLLWNLNRTASEKNIRNCLSLSLLLLQTGTVLPVLSPSSSTFSSKFLHEHKWWGKEERNVVEQGGVQAAGSQHNSTDTFRMVKFKINETREIRGQVGSWGILVHGVALFLQHTEVLLSALWSAQLYHMPGSTFCKLCLDPRNIYCHVGKHVFSTAWLVSTNSLTRLANLFFPTLKLTLVGRKHSFTSVRAKLCCYQRSLWVHTTLLGFVTSVEIKELPVCYKPLNPLWTGDRLTMKATNYLNKAKLPAQQFFISRAMSFRKSPNTLKLNKLLLSTNEMLQHFPGLFLQFHLFPFKSKETGYIIVLTDAGCLWGCKWNAV